jgi:hypothetical protein
MTSFAFTYVGTIKLDSNGNAIGMDVSFGLHSLMDT